MSKRTSFWRAFAVLGIALGPPVPANSASAADAKQLLVLYSPRHDSVTATIGDRELFRIFNDKLPE